MNLHLIAKLAISIALAFALAFFGIINANPIVPPAHSAVKFSSTIMQNNDEEDEEEDEEEEEEDEYEDEPDNAEEEADEEEDDDNGEDDNEEQEQRDEKEQEAEQEEEEETEKELKFELKSFRLTMWKPKGREWKWITDRAALSNYDAGAEGSCKVAIKRESPGEVFILSLSALDKSAGRLPDPNSLINQFDRSIRDFFREKDMKIDKKAKIRIAGEKAVTRLYKGRAKDGDAVLFFQIIAFKKNQDLFWIVIQCMGGTEKKYAKELKFILDNIRVAKK